MRTQDNYEIDLLQRRAIFGIIQNCFPYASIMIYREKHLEVWGSEIQSHKNQQRYTMPLLW